MQPSLGWMGANARGMSVPGRGLNCPRDRVHEFCAPDTSIGLWTLGDACIASTSNTMQPILVWTGKHVWGIGFLDQGLGGPETRRKSAAIHKQPLLYEPTRTLLGWETVLAE